MNIKGNHIIYNGKLLLASEITTPDPSLYAVIYEVFRIENYKPLFIHDHLVRMFNSLQKAVTKVSFSKDDIINDIDNLISNENIKDGNIKISCFSTKNTVETLLIHYIPTFYPSDEMYNNGVSTILLHAERENPNIKIDNTSTRKKAIDILNNSHHYEALLVNHDDLITEGSKSNIFFIHGDHIYTSPEHFILPGIMRSKVIDCILKEDIELRFECLNINQLQHIDAAFITGTSPRILPISQIDNFKLDVNNKLLRLLMKDLAELIR
ncbi:aminotransferase class IV [Plebeiibacterium sediminum]|uniref:branched-chain-amino-acid transaminase n=1 Tax=Plebeiibacterium sediminum TaxID=2992112 RepID=A0AAE3M5Q9_9BACT|nr:aminotransferase class IV [Plebeiobacterium sediminum]MCW3787624.1 aminotransferase class IV [Plebeiobacterium sediminum]